MAIVTAKVTGLDGLAQDFMTASGRVGKLGREALEDVAEATLEAQRQLVPKRTWELHNDLEVWMSGDGRSATLVAHVGSSLNPPRQAFFQENGTARMSAHPFAGPSADLADRELPKRIERVMDEVADVLSS